MSEYKRLSKENWQLFQKLFTSHIVNIPVATENQLGMIKIGNGLYLDNNNKLNVSYASSPSSGEIHLSEDPTNILLFKNDGLYVGLDIADPKDVKQAVINLLSKERNEL